MVRLLKSALRPVRRRARVWMENRSMKARVRKGLRLVPEAELEHKYREALQALTEKAGAAPLGDYLEFGVYNGTSLACMYRALESLRLDRVRLFGFDSFEGMPKEANTDDGGMWTPGQFKSEFAFTRQFLTEQNVNWDRVTLVKGWFSDTLTNGLIRDCKITKASVIMVDCDIYSSAKTALDFCGPLIQDHTVIFFDDWNSGGLAERNLGEKCAFDEFLQENPHFITEDFGSYGETDAVFLISHKPGTG